jgi:anti-anti-sigma factor
VKLVDLRFEERGRVVLASLDGEVDMSNAEALRKALESNMPNDALGLVLDCTAVRYLDSAGIHLLFKLREQLRNRGQELRLVVPGNAPIADVLALADIPAAVGVADTVEAALDGMEPAADGESAPG